MKEFSNIASSIRKNILKMMNKSKSSHIGSCLSIVDILTTLYFEVLNIDHSDPKKKDRDIFILSKAHASAALYSTLAERGFFERKRLDEYYIDGGSLPGHLDRTIVPGVEISGGSLGHGLSVGLGMAIAKLNDKNAGHVYVLVGDGELNEGSVWEALMFAGSQNINNITMIVDYNKLQGLERDVHKLSNLRERFDSFGWQSLEIDGHNFNDINTSCAIKSEKPKAIIANTVKGKGVSYMEDSMHWHYKSPDNHELDIALEELKK